MHMMAHGPHVSSGHRISIMLYSEAWSLTGRGRARRRRTPVDPKDTGGSLFREDATKATLLAPRGVRLCEGYGSTRSCAELARNMSFCETNPPFFLTIFCVSRVFSVTYVVCRSGLQVGSFWKTNPPEGCFWGRERRKMGLDAAGTALWRKTDPLPPSRS